MWKESGWGLWLGHLAGAPCPRAWKTAPGSMVSARGRSCLPASRASPKPFGMAGLRLLGRAVVGHQGLRPQTGDSTLWGHQLFIGLVRGVGCCQGLRSSETSRYSWSSGACLLVSLALVSGIHVFTRGPPMPAGLACLGGTFSVFEVQLVVSNPGLMLVYCLKLCQIPGRHWHPCPRFSLYFTRSCSEPCGQQIKEVTCLYSPLVPHAWIFSLAREFLSPCQPCESSSSWAVALSPGLSAPQTTPRMESQSQWGKRCQPHTKAPSHHLSSEHSRASLLGIGPS